MMPCCQLMNLSSRWVWRWSIEKSHINDDALREQCRGEPHAKPLGTCMNVACLSSSAEHSRLPRKSRSGMDLRKELQDFIFATGLPSDQVPSMKELARHGRQDLANIVRRRGFKAVAQLLTDPKRTYTTKSEAKKQMDGSTAASAGKEYEASDSSHSVELSNLSPHKKLSGSDDRYNSFINDEGDFLDQSSNVDILYSKEDWSAGEHLVTAHSPESVDTVGRNSDYYLKSSLIISLHQRAANFVRTGEFRDIEDGVEIEEYSDDEESNDNTYKTCEVDDAIPLTPYSMDTEKASYGPSECDFGIPLSTGSIAFNEAGHKSCEWNGCTPLISDIKAANKSVSLTTKLQPLFRDKSYNAINTKFNNQPQLNADGIPEELEIRSAGVSASLMDLDYLKCALHLKELELAKIRQELEKEKAELSFIHAKAMTEVADAKRIVSEKDSQLSAVDQALMDLKQVQIEYWGDGQKVEVTGSFNGWQHHIAMEPDFSSEIQNPNGARGPLMWSTELWLYPGIYEIKFIVDGNWQVDPRREVVMRDMIQNNVLKVEY